MVAQCVSTAKAARSYQPGVHVPSVTWFGDDARQNIDWDVQTKHFDFLIKSGVTGGEIWRE
jgi:4-hydroxy-2-oxoglutarate aldolase